MVIEKRNTFENSVLLIFSKDLIHNNNNNSFTNNGAQYIRDISKSIKVIQGHY